MHLTPRTVTVIANRKLGVIPRDGYLADGLLFLLFEGSQLIRYGVAGTHRRGSAE